MTQPNFRPIGLCGCGDIACFQNSVQNWQDSLFMGTEYEPSRKTRGWRFMEEALELLQAEGFSRSEINVGVNYVYNRPRGETSQELAGVNVCLNLLACAAGVDLARVSQQELDRINTAEMREKIYNKQQFKKDHGLWD